MDEIPREALIFGSAKYALPQFTFVPDGDHLLIGYSYGTRREYLSRVPIPEVGSWLIAHAEFIALHREEKLRRPQPASGDDLLSELGLL